MSNDSTPNVMPVLSPWRTILLEALAHVKRRLLMVSPFMKEEVVTAMRQALLLRESQPAIDIRVITRVEPGELLSGASDLRALQQLLAWSRKIPRSTIEMRAVPNVHAKVWVCDTHLAIVGSGNATPSGLDDNLEYGLAVSDTPLVERVLSDWQVWWDRAERVEAEALEEIAQQLQQVKRSDALHQSQAQNDMVRRELSKIPRIGRHIAPASASPLVVNDPTASYPALKAPLPALPESFTIFASQLWQALHWAFPGFHKEHAYEKATPKYTHGAFLKLSWKPHVVERSMLQCIWADGKRLSQATIPGDQATMPTPWTITLNLDQLSKLGAFFASLNHNGLLDERAATFLCVSLHLSPTQLHLEYRGSAAEVNSAAAISIPCALAGMPASFPTLRPPLSQITVEQRRLLDTVTSLKREWYERHSPEQPLTVVELSLTTPGPSSALTLSTGQLEEPITRTIPGTDCTIAGSEARIRVNFTALQQVITSAHSNVHHWRLSIDSYVEAVQFIPQPGMLNDENLFWGHQLWSY